MTINIVAPVTLLTDIKNSLIKLGYAHEGVSLEFIQDAYYKYIIVRQTGMNPNVPYALDLLPQSLLEQLTPVGGGGGGTGDNPLLVNGKYILEAIHFSDIADPKAVLPTVTQNLAYDFLVFFLPLVGILPGTENYDIMLGEVGVSDVLSGHGGLAAGQVVEGDVWVEGDVTHISFDGTTPSTIATYNAPDPKFVQIIPSANKAAPSGLVSVKPTLLIPHTKLQPLLDTLGTTFATAGADGYSFILQTFVHANGFDQPATDNFYGTSIEGQQLNAYVVEKGYFAATANPLAIEGKYNRIVIKPKKGGVVLNDKGSINIDITLEHKGITLP